MDDALAYAVSSKMEKAVPNKAFKGIKLPHNEQIQHYFLQGGQDEVTVTCPFC